MDGKTIWVVGASAGIGAEIARMLAALGHFVIVSARDEHALNQLCLAHPGRLKSLPFDVAAADRFDSVRNQLLDLTDYLDGIIYCAGVCEYENKLDFNYTQYERVMKINFLGLIATLSMGKALLKKSSGRAQLCVLSSLATAVPFPRNEIYGASKAALDYFVAALRCDTTGLPLDITWVRPGFVSTRLTAKNDFSMPFLMDTHAAAAIIVQGFLRRKAKVVFPLRLYTLLLLMSLLQPIWQFILKRFLTRTKAW